MTRVVWYQRLKALLIVIVGASTAHAQQSSDTVSNQRRPPTTEPTGVFQIPTPSPVCEQRSLCASTTPTTSTLRHPSSQHPPSDLSRNCFCDDLCGVYDDCCSDFRPQPPLPDRNLRLSVSCQRLADSELGTNTSEMYVVTRCPMDYDDDDYVRERCERQPGPLETANSAAGPTSVDDDRFLRLPVRGGPPFHLLYRNAYCALCYGERRFVFWRAVLHCGGVPRTTTHNTTNLLRSLAHGSPACPTVFVPSRESMTESPPPRPCKVNIGRCDRSWTDKVVARKCRERTNYVYAGNRVFRNRECAICNYVNETYLRCEDNRSTPPTESDGTNKIVLEEYVPYVVRLDFNRHQATISYKQDSGRWHGRQAEVDLTFPHCSGGGVYDPFIDRCRLISCPSGYARRDGHCAPSSRPEVISTPDVSASHPTRFHKTAEAEMESYDDDDNDYFVHSFDVTSEMPPSQVTARQCPLLPVNSTDVQRFGNGSVYVTSLHRTFLPDQILWQSGSMFVCVPDTVRTNTNIVSNPDPVFLSQRYNFTMFQFEPSQRSLALVGAIVCLVSIFIQLLVFAMFTSMWANTDGKCVLCLALSLFLAQLFYLFIILVWEQFPGAVVCFVISEVMQYFFLAAFCWLNVVSIDVFRWLKSSESSSSAYSYIAEECCTRFMWYSIYAWSVPIIVITGSVCTTVLRIDGWHPYEGRSGGCWVMGLSQLMLFTLPICLLLAVNVILYVIAAFKFCLEPFPGRLEHHRNKYKHRCIISMQMSVLMGMTWLFAVVAVSTRWPFLWYLFVLFDVLQGLFLCAAFVCTRKVYRLFCSKGRIRRLSDGTGRTSASKYRGKSSASINKLSPMGAKNRVIMLETSI